MNSYHWHHKPETRHRGGATSAASIWLVLLVLLTVTAPVRADFPNENLIYLALTGNTPLDQHMTSLLQEALGEDTDILPYTASQSPTNTRVPVIALGQEALTRVWQASRNTPILALLVDQSFIRGYIRRSEGLVSSIFYDPPLLRQALVGRVILPHSTRVAMLASPETAELYEQVLAQLPDYGLAGKVFVAGSEQDLIPALTRALSYGDFLLAAPDDHIYNPRTIKHILLTAYRRNRIVIGPSQAYVKAGTLASTYTSLPAVAELTADYIARYRASGHFPPPSYPEQFDIAVNRQVARSLNIPVPGDDVIIRELKKHLDGSRTEAPDE